MSSIEEIMLTDYPIVYGSDPLTKVLGFFSERVAEVVVVQDKVTGKLIGVVTKRAMLKPNLNPLKVPAKTLAVKTPRILPSHTVEETALRMVETNLKALPVTKDDKPVGLVTAADVVLSSKDTIENIEVGRVMTKDVITINVNDTIGRAISLMRDEGVSRLPVVDNGLLAGIVTVTDIVEKVIKPRMRTSWGEISGEKVRTLSNPVKGIMTRNVVTTTPYEKIVRAVEVMKSNSFSSLVVTERKRVVGIFTLMDALEPLAAKKAEGEKEIVVEVSYRMEAVDPDVKASVMEAAERFVKKFKKALGNGVLSLYFKEHREKHGDLKLIHCRARLNSDKFQFVGIGENWRADLAAVAALKVIERQLLVKKELAAKYPFGKEFFEFLYGGY